VSDTPSPAAASAGPVSPDAFDRPRTVDSGDGLHLATYDLGGDGPELLFVHANGFCAGAWGPLASRLDDHHRFALDLRGHGRSDGPDPAAPDAYRWDGVADDVLAAVDALGLVGPVGIGHSMGGAALVLAEERRPGTFAALWLYEPIIFPPAAIPPSDGSNPLSDGALRRRSEFPSVQAAVENFSSKRPLDELHPDALGAYVRHGFEERADGSVTLRCRPEVEAANFRMGAVHDAWDRLDRVRCPTVVLAGHTEPGTPSAFAAAIAERLPAGRLEAHPELGHFGPLAALDTMARSIRTLVDG
jgi:pimeloyl-ACP methyl ester carboxylesterase